MIFPFLARNLFIPIVDGLSTRGKVIQALKEAEELQWHSLEEIMERQWPKIQKLIHDAYLWVPYYRKTFDEHGISIKQIQAPDDLKRIPILTKEDINTYREEMVDPRYRARIYENRSGGSTGMPTRFYQVEEHWIKNTAATIKNYKWCGVNEGERISILWGDALDVGKLTAKMGRLKNFFINKHVIPTLTLSEKMLIDTIEKIRRFRPKLILGYSTYLVALAEKVLELNVVDIRPKAVMSSANTLFISQRKIIESAFGTQVFDRYGGRELGCIACECSVHKGFHVNMENVYVEYEKLPEGNQDEEMHRLICTSMGNYGMPFIRYEIGDIGVPAQKACSCGRGLPMIKELKGRYHDILKTPSGKIITGNLFEIIFLNYAHLIKQFQVRQTKINKVQVLLVLRKGVEEKNIGVVKTTMERIIGSDMKISFKITDQIAVSDSDKLRSTISELSNS